MSLSVPAYTAPQFAAPIAGAYAWIAGLGLDFQSGGELITLHIHPDAASAGAGKPPLDRVTFRSGQAVGTATIATLAQLSATDSQFAQAFSYIRQVIYNEVKKDPRFAGATDVA